MIRPSVDAVFIHVIDVPRALAWYQDMLGLSQGVTSHEGLIAEVPVEGSTRLLLDGHMAAMGRRVVPEGVRLMFATTDLERDHAWAGDHAAHVSPVEDIGSAMVIYLDDPDDNRVCIIWRKPISS